MIRPWICCQLGAREHYAVPRVLHHANRLAMLYTDYWAGTGTRALAHIAPFRRVQSLAGRFHPDLAEAPITSWNVSTAQRAWTKHRQQNQSAGIYSNHLEIGSRFACAVREMLNRHPNVRAGRYLFAYDTAALELLESLAEMGIRSALNQMDLNRVEAELVRREEKRWPGWSNRPTEIPEEYFRRREKEWALASRIIVNTEFCRQAVIRQGVPPSKVAVIPLSFEPAISPLELERTIYCQRLVPPSRQSPLRVLWLGQVILRKGIQYLLQAARLLEGEPIYFDVVGPLGISNDAIASAPSNMAFHGRVSREQAAEWFRGSHIFVFPTLSDGFGISQLEAMAYGLPVIATPNCGPVVSDGMDGFVIPPGDAAALASAIQRYQDCELVREHGIAALKKSKHFSLTRLKEHLLMLEQDLDAFDI